MTAKFSHAAVELGCAYHGRIFDIELPNIFDDILSSKTHKQPQYRLKRKQVGNSKLTSLSSNFGLNN